MIFVTVGTQLPFDRLVGAVDRFYAESDESVFAQVGASELTLSHIRHTDYLPPEVLEDRIQHCDLMIAHAGMGSVLTAMKYHRRVIVMPRHADLGEHRNDHQVSTAKWIGTLPGVVVAADESELQEILGNLDHYFGAECEYQFSDKADQALISFLMDEIEGKDSIGKL